MNRGYNMFHRVTYQQIIDTLKDFQTPITYETLYDNLPCEPDYIVLQDKLNKMVEKGMVKSECDGGAWDYVYYSIAE